MAVFQAFPFILLNKNRFHTKIHCILYTQDHMIYFITNVLEHINKTTSSVRIEPTTSRLTVERANRLRHEDTIQVHSGIKHHSSESTRLDNQLSAIFAEFFLKCDPHFYQLLNHKYSSK